MRLLPLLLLVTTLFAQPVRTAWIRAAAGPGTAQPDVHSVELTQDAVIVRSAGISLAWLGPLGVDPAPPRGPRQYEFRIPLRPAPETGRHAHVPASHAGVFLNGVPIYNPFEVGSYQDRNLWHFDTVARNAKSNHAPPRPGLLEGLLPDRGRHSPIIGFALDGYPVYGPWTNQGRMRSSYRLRSISVRDRWPDGTFLAPGQEGPPVSPEFPLGTFAEDYEYVPGAGDLDPYNGRFVKTPEYPEGTYAYFLSTGADGGMAFPYLFAHEFYGQYSSATVPGLLQFPVPGNVRHLEFVHEKPMHVLVISRDLAAFAHIHPEVNEFGVWQAPFPFTHGGRFRVYADYTPPGGNQRIDHYDIDRPGPQPAPTATPANPGVTLENAMPLRAGEDVELRFRVSDEIRLWQPYLGAWAHIVIAADGLRSLQHAHPAESETQGTGQHTHTFTAPPPTLRVLANFAGGGHYRLWFQMQINDEVVTIPFDLQVSAAAAKPAAQQAIPRHAVRLQITPHGFEPMRVQAASGRPLTLAVTRTGESNCGNQIVFPTLGITRALPLGTTTRIDLPALPAGELRFTCGMGMYRGSVMAVSAVPSPALPKTRSASESPAPRKP